MKSKWYESKPKAVLFRRRGNSIKDINRKLGVPLSTLSGWLRDVKLSDSKKEKLQKRWREALVKARLKAVLWHKTQKEIRLNQAKEQAQLTFSQLEFSNINSLKLALSMLYLGEGFKGQELGIGNSDPQIIRFFLASLKAIYGIKIENIKCELHLRADQNADGLRKFWSKQLHIPLTNFKRVYFDVRTKNSKTYPTYKGVCMIRMGNVAIQRELLYLGKLYCEKVTVSFLRD